MDIGSSYEFTYQVQTQDLAKVLSNDPADDFPAVFATSRMIAIMELAAARLMKPCLAEGELSVGVNVNVTHTAATLNDETVQAVATFIGMEGKLYKFAVELLDRGGSAGLGTHTRAIVKTQRLLQGAASRLDAGS